jgi:hypothetical protein
MTPSKDAYRNSLESSLFRTFALTAVTDRDLDLRTLTLPRGYL